jgi:hypothetical protein
MSEIKWVAVQLPEWLVVNLYDGILDGEIKDYTEKLRQARSKKDQSEAQYFMSRIVDLEVAINSLRPIFNKIMAGES